MVGGELGVGLVDGVAWLVAVLVVGVSCFGGDVELVCSVDAGTLGRLLDEDFRPCLACLGTALERLRATASRLDERT